MSTTLVGIIISAFVSMVGFWIKLRLSQAAKDRQQREILERETKDLKNALKLNQEANLAHNKRVIEIYDNVSDSNFVSRLLSEQINPSQIPPTSTP
jgi:hypothetical protein